MHPESGLPEDSLRTFRLDGFCEQDMNAAIVRVIQRAQKAAPTEFFCLARTEAMDRGDRGGGNGEQMR